MKRLLAILAVVLMAAPAALAVSNGNEINPVINTEDFAPRVWMCDSRVVLDDEMEPGRLGYDTLYERMNNYAFEGVFDKNGINKIEDVFVTLGDVQGEGNDIEANCVLNELGPRPIDASCNARIDEEELNPGDFENWNQLAAS